MIDQSKAETTSVKKNTNRFIIHNIIELFLSSWYWLVVSVILCLLCAWIYLKMSPDMFQVSATMQINSPQTPVNQDVMKAFRNPSDAEREIYFFRSRQVIADVVKGLNLNVKYIRPNLFVDEDLYEKSPIDAYFVGNEYPPCQFEITCNTADFLLTSIETDKNERAHTWRGHYGDTVVTDKGVLVIQKRPFASNVNDFKMQIHYTTPDIATGQYMGAMNAEEVDEDAGNIQV